MGTIIEGYQERLAEREIEPMRRSRHSPCVWMRFRVS